MSHFLHCCIFFLLSCMCFSFSFDLVQWFLIVFYCNIEAGSKFWNIYFFSFPLYLCLTFPQQAGPSLTHFPSVKCSIGHLPLWWQLMSCAVFVFVVFFSSILPCNICAKVCPLLPIQQMFTFLWRQLMICARRRSSGRQRQTPLSSIGKPLPRLLFSFSLIIEGEMVAVG